MLADTRRWIGQEYRRAALPLGCYYTMTLLVPLVNGAGQPGAFFDHAVVVLSVPLVLVTLVAASRACVRAGTSAVPLRRTAPNQPRTPRAVGALPPRMSAARESGAVMAETTHP